MPHATRVSMANEIEKYEADKHTPHTSICMEEQEEGSENNKDFKI